MCLRWEWLQHYRLVSPASSIPKADGDDDPGQNGSNFSSLGRKDLGEVFKYKPGRGRFKLISTW